jgi:hypothetical protein
MKTKQMKIDEEGEKEKSASFSSVIRSGLFLPLEVRTKTVEIRT